MACKTSLELHHYFPKLAEDSCFTFNNHRPRNRIDWNKIRLIDIESLMKERKFVIIEQHLNDILDCVLESEFDVRILDEGVIKMFRLAQLTVEYQQFCRQYLDRSVYVLREEITAIAKELDTHKKELREKDEEIRKLRKRSKHSYKTSVPYGNDNIATMILKTLSQQKGELFPSTSADILHYNKCDYCEKVFLNQLYLKSHISRRHSELTEEPQKDKQEKSDSIENIKLVGEVTELKNKIKELETIIEHTTNTLVNHGGIDQSKDNLKNKVEETKTATKDAEVSTDKEDYLLAKIEEWKKSELENYNKEMDKLRSQIMDTINAIKDNDKKENDKTKTEPDLTLQLQETIKQQGAQILALSKELNDSKLNTENEKTDRNKETEAQIKFWTKQAEAQSEQYELLLQKLNDVTKSAEESRTSAKTERERASQLQMLLQQTITSQTKDKFEGTNNKVPIQNQNTAHIKKKSANKKHLPNRTKKEINPETFETLHRRAQELLNMELILTNSDTSSAESNKLPTRVNNIKGNETKNNVLTKPLRKSAAKNDNQHKNEAQIQNSSYVNQQKPKKETAQTNNNNIEYVKENHSTKMSPGSPMKILRAKITEEVNNRLVSAGVDPLKPRLPGSVFQKQRIQLHRQTEIKSKQNPDHERTRHKILAYLDSNTNLNKDMPLNDYVSPSKATKTFKNISSIISNVKTRALSLVKPSDENEKETRKNKKLNQAEVADRALALLRTPPESSTPSPVVDRHRLFKSSKSHGSLAHNISHKNSNGASKPQLERQPKAFVDATSSPKSPKMTSSTNLDESYSDQTLEESDHNYNTTSVRPVSKSIDHLIKSPARQPSSATAEYNHTARKYTITNENSLHRTQSALNLNNHTSQNQCSSEDEKSVADNLENINKQTKSVLKNASSTSSINKKKVLFDMDAIQMKSMSASPSQSITEKSDGKEKYELGLINLDGEEWDISSIEDEPLKNDTKIQNVTHHASPKIAILKEKIESQLARRNETTLIGGVDVLTGNMVKTASVGGSNTSLGSSILDDSESAHIVNQKTFIKPKLKPQVKDDSDIDILSELSIGGIANKNESF